MARRLCMPLLTAGMKKGARCRGNGSPAIETWELDDPSHRSGVDSQL